MTYNYAENGGTSATKATAAAAYGSSIDLTPKATKDGWEFVGWNTDKNAQTGLTSLTMGAGSKTLYAIYKKTLTSTFYSGSSRTTQTRSVTIYNNATSGSVTAPTLTAWSGYTALGWNGSESGYAAERVANDSISISANTSYYGVYSKEVTLTYNANGGTGDRAYTANWTEIKYNVAVDTELAGGSLSADTERAAAGHVITVTVTPESDYRLKPGTLVYKVGGKDYKIGLTDGTYQFTMPASDVTVAAEFEAAASDGISTPEELWEALGGDDYAVIENGVVKLKKDVTPGETLVITGELTLDLNGQTIKTSVSVTTAFEVTGTLTITDSANPNGGGVTGNIKVDTGGHLTISDAKVTEDAGENGTVIVEKDGTVTGAVKADTGYIWGTTGEGTEITKGVVPTGDGQYKVEGNPTVDGRFRAALPSPFPKAPH